MALSDLEARVVGLLADNEKCGILSITGNTAARCLSVTKTDAHSVLRGLLLRGLVVYAPKNGASQEERYKLADRRRGS